MRTDSERRARAVELGKRPTRAPDDGLPVLVADLPSRVLATKEGETFLYSDNEGNLHDRHELGFGFYHRDTRFLSHFEMRISGSEPVLLSSSAERAYMSHVDLTNPDLFDDGRLVAPQQTLSIRRIRVVGDRLYEKIRIKNYNGSPIRLELSLTFGADFADIFEVRGLNRERAGHFEAPSVEGRAAEFAYLGVDGVRRATRIVFGAKPSRLDLRGDLVEAAFDVQIPANQTKTVSLQVEPVIAPATRLPKKEFDATVQELRSSYEAWEREGTRIRTDNELFNELLTRGLRDLRALYMEGEKGGIIAAGIPWYVAPFGRDSLIASHQMLMVNTRPARETLRLLGALQGKEMDDWRDEEPGKILHEIRRGELAGAGEVPHASYYGSVDSTPWFLILLAQYFRWTGDVEFVREMLPAAEAALTWIDRSGNLNGDGFLRYRTRSPRGLRNQGWKDSWNSIVHPDGTLAEPPIALVEAQAYVYMAQTRMADVFAALGDHERAVALRDQAQVLRMRFNEVFWMEDEKYFAAALDGGGRQVRTTVSNPGHGLYCDVVEPAKAEHMAQRLFQPDMFSGWGIRSMSKNEAPYNPMSYHNGSVWPHDNALIAAGLKRYGFVEATNRVATALFDAAVTMDYKRLPELFCGFVRRSPTHPVLSRVAMLALVQAVSLQWATFRSLLVKSK